MVGVFDLYFAVRYFVLEDLMSTRTSTARHTSLQLSLAWFAAACVLFTMLGTKAVAADDIVICTVDDLSGDFSIMATPKTYGYQLAVKEINDTGGILGKKVVLKTYDGQSDVKRYQELAQKCIFDDKANVVMAGYTGAEREAARREVVRNKLSMGTTIRGKGESPTNTHSSPVPHPNSRYCQRLST